MKLNLRFLLASILVSKIVFAQTPPEDVGATKDAAAPSTKQATVNTNQASDHNPKVGVLLEKLHRQTLHSEQIDLNTLNHEGKVKLAKLEYDLRLKLPKGDEDKKFERIHNRILDLAEHSPQRLEIAEALLGITPPNSREGSSIINRYKAVNQKLDEVRVDYTLKDSRAGDLFKRVGAYLTMNEIRLQIAYDMASRSKAHDPGFDAVYAQRNQYLDNLQKATNIIYSSLTREEQHGEIAFPLTEALPPPRPQRKNKAKPVARSLDPAVKKGEETMVTKDNPLFEEYKKNK